MSKSQETFNKKEKEKKRLKNRLDKKEKKEERKANAKKGVPLEEMMAYIDEDGNISSVPPDPKKKKIFKQEDMQISIPRYEAGQESDAVRTGVITFFNYDKGFGFIRDSQTQESIFVHVNQLEGPVKENDKISFEVEKGPKGFNAINAKKIN